MSEAEEIWRSRSDDQVIAAADALAEYSEEGEQAIRAELRRRGLSEPPPPLGVCLRCGRSIGDNHPMDECAQCGEPLPSKILEALLQLRLEARRDAATAPELRPDEIAVLAGIMRKTHPWALFVGIVGLVTAGFMIVNGIGNAMAGLRLQNPESLDVLVMPFIFMFYVLTSIYLLRYANRMRLFAAQCQVHQLERALQAQRVFWKFVGLVTLAGFAVPLVSIVFALIIGTF